MIFDASTLGAMTITADLCIIGSGAGGSSAAAVAAEAGLKVVILEAGPFVPPSVMNQREEDMIPALLEANGAQTSADRGCAIIQGRALGGSTVHNINLCKRIPLPILQEWIAKNGLEHLPIEAWDALYTEVESLLEVSTIPPDLYSAHNLLLKQGAEKLGWTSGGLQHNRSGCVSSGFCAVGCAYDAKNNAVKVFIPRAVDAGAQILTHCKAVRILTRDKRVIGVEAVALDPLTRDAIGRITINCPQVCVSASATGSAALLLRSDIPDPSGRTGRGLTIHPALVAAGEFDEPVYAWKGIPQSYECTQFLNFEAAHPPVDADQSLKEAASLPGHRSWLITAFAHPMSTATMLPGFGGEHSRLMARYDHLAVFSAMVHDQSAGRVTPRGDLGWKIDWTPNQADQRELLYGTMRATEMLFAAGAKRVVFPSRPLLDFKPGDSLARLETFAIRPDTVQITAVHPMSTVPMGNDPRQSPVDSRGKHHHMEGLWVADGSLFPTSIGVPPQLSIYAMGLHVGRAIVASVK